MKRILVVEDSKTARAQIQNEFSLYCEAEIIYAKTYKDAMKKIRKFHGKFHAALLDLNLPDAPNGEVVSLANAHHIPSVVLTGNMNLEVKRNIQKKDILAYILKDTNKSIKLAVKFLQRALRNYDTNVLIVDDSKLYRQILSNLLKEMNINVFEAEDGLEALEFLKTSKDKISLVLTDFEMPKMNGLELTIKIREIFDKNELGIIALSTVDDTNIISDFLRFGANDFINKPFNKNEISIRINSNLEILDLFTQISDMANKDFLTAAYNRRYFYDSGEAIFLKAKRKKEPIAVAMLDIDNFKYINDTYGHNIGDIAIKEVKNVLDKNLRASDLLARFGGEEFCIVLEDITQENVLNLFEKIRVEFEKNIIVINDINIQYTVSFGIAFGLAKSLEEMVRLSDNALYDSKHNGRNQITLQHINF